MVGQLYWLALVAVICTYNLIVRRASVRVQLSSLWDLCISNNYMIIVEITRSNSIITSQFHIHLLGSAIQVLRSAEV